MPYKINSTYQKEVKLSKNNQRNIVFFFLRLLLFLAEDQSCGLVFRLATFASELLRTDLRVSEHQYVFLFLRESELPSG